MRQTYKQINLRQPSLDTIAKANEIINEYSDIGLKLTLRQLYYQFVARDIISNTQKSYKNLGRLLSAGRLAGLIDWNAIEDRTEDLYHFKKILDSTIDFVKKRRRVDLV